MGGSKGGVGKSAMADFSRAINIQPEKLKLRIARSTICAELSMLDIAIADIQIITRSLPNRTEFQETLKRIRSALKVETDHVASGTSGGRASTFAVQNTPVRKNVILDKRAAPSMRTNSARERIFDDIFSGMKLFWKLIGCTVGLMVGLCWGNQVMGETPDGHVAPLNPAFIRYFEIGARESLRDEWRPGLIPSPVDSAALGGRRRPMQRGKVSLPAYYDLRTTGRLSPVKNQFPYGTCWAHATMGALESRLLPAQAWDLSENNLANLHGFDFGFNDGGGNLIGIACLARWTGPVTESEDPYPNPGHSPVDLPPCLHLQEAFFVSSRHSELDNDDLKQAMIDYGGVYVGMFWGDDAYNDTYKSYYYTGTNNNNHAVIMVGWDDNFPAQNFTTPAAGNGAFIIKNSFGSNWADRGYFYASYYDLKMAPGGCTVFGAEPATNYSGVYQYDPFGWVTTVRYTDETWGANIFTATSACPLWAASFYTPEYDADYEIRIYRNVTEDQPSSGVLALKQTGTFTQQGYHTVRLNTPVGLAAGERFSVVLHFPGTTATYPICVEYACSNYSSAATASPGQSFFGPDGENWEDLTEYIASGNVCLKAFTGWPAEVTIGMVAGDYDADGKTDPAVYNETTGVWLIMLSGQGYAMTTTTFGGPGYVPVAADYDADGKADPTVYNEATGYWYVILSSRGYGLVSLALGGPGYVPVPADFDGDRKADPCVYNAALGDWMVMLSSQGYGRAEVTGFGGIGCAPASADYDGDKRVDPGVYANALALYMVMLSYSGYTLATAAVGGAGFIPSPDDYDGDGKADPALYSPAVGGWNILLSESGYTPVLLSQAGTGYVPAAGDFDGDDKADYMVYSESAGLWSIMLSASSNTIATVSLGGAGFMAVGAAR